MALTSQQNKKQQRCHNTSFSVTFPSLWLQPQEQRTHTMAPNQPADQKKKTSQLLFLYYLSFSTVATPRAEITQCNGTKPAIGDQKPQEQQQLA
jgi:hypothetical protein